MKAATTALAMLIVLAMAFCMAGCPGTTNNDPPGNNDDPPGDDPPADDPPGDDPPGGDDPPPNLGALPQAQWLANVTTGPGPLTVQFSDFSVPNDSAIESWRWHFGDLLPSWHRQPIHTFGEGIYTISLTVTNRAGSDTLSRLGHIRVGPTPIVTNGVPIRPPAQAFDPALDLELVSVPAGWFKYGPVADEPYSGGAATPADIFLPTYHIGKYEVTARQFALVMNWARARGWIRLGWELPNSKYAYRDEVPCGTPGGPERYTAYLNTPEVAGWPPQIRPKLALFISGDWCGSSAIQVPHGRNPIVWVAGGTQFFIEKRDGYDMSDHPATYVTYLGAAMFCNWASMYDKDLAPCYSLRYDQINGNYIIFLGRTRPVPDGYRLPTKQEWEKAAGWEQRLNQGAGGHWMYGNSSHAVNSQRANILNANPLRLSRPPWTSPIGYYRAWGNNGDSISPYGCFDMMGNVFEIVENAGYSFSDPYPLPIVGNLGGEVTNNMWLRGGSHFTNAEGDWSGLDHIPPVYQDFSVDSGAYLPHTRQAVGFRVARTPDAND